MKKVMKEDIMLKENLIMLRNIHGFSQEEIAEKIDISRQAYKILDNAKKCTDQNQGCTGFHFGGS